MRNLKLFSLCLFLFTTTILIQSCSKESCEGVTCAFDGSCDDGSCVCTQLTKNYLVGTWILESTGNVVGTFNEDNTFIDSFGNEVAWELDVSTNIIKVTPGNSIIVHKEGFGCTQMNVTIDSGTTQTDFIFIRQ